MDYTLRLRVLEYPNPTRSWTWFENTRVRQVIDNTVYGEPHTSTYTYSLLIQVSFYTFYQASCYFRGRSGSIEERDGGQRRCCSMPKDRMRRHVHRWRQRWRLLPIPRFCKKIWWKAHPFPNLPAPVMFHLAPRFLFPGIVLKPLSLWRSQIFYSSIGIFAFVWFLDSVKHFHFLPNSLISCCYKGRSFWFESFDLLFRCEKIGVSRTSSMMCIICSEITRRDCSWSIKMSRNQWKF